MSIKLETKYFITESFIFKNEKTFFKTKIIFYRGKREIHTFKNAFQNIFVSVFYVHGGFILCSICDHRLNNLAANKSE